MTRVQHQACWLLCVVIVLVSLPAAADVSYFACPRVGYFSEPCAVPIAPAPTTQSGEEPLDSDTRLGADEPLFTPDTVSPDTPPLFYQLLLEPTESNARAYYLWHLKRMVRTRQVQAILNNIRIDPEIRYWLEQLRASRSRTQLDLTGAPKPPTQTPPVPSLQNPPMTAHQTELPSSEVASKIKEALAAYKVRTEQQP